MKAVLALVVYEASRWWWLGPLSGLFLAVAGLVVANSGLAAATLTLLGGLGVGLEAWAKSAARVRSDEVKILINYCMQPMTRSLLVLACKTTKEARERKLPDVLWPILTAALNFTDVQRSRASFFVRTRLGGVDYLVPHPTLSAGRGDPPMSRFQRGVGEGKEVWRLAEAGEAAFYSDLTVEAPPGMDRTRERSYKTFITVPVEVNGTLVGLLTINAERPGDLRRDDVGVMRVLAGTAGVALAICGGQWPEDDADLLRGGERGGGEEVVLGDGPQSR